MYKGYFMSPTDGRGIWTDETSFNSIRQPRNWTNWFYKHSGENWNFKMPKISLIFVLLMSPTLKWVQLRPVNSYFLNFLKLLSFIFHFHESYTNWHFMSPTDGRGDRTYETSFNSIRQPRIWINWFYKYSGEKLEF